MKAISNIHQNRQGSTLLAVLGYLFLATGLVATILTLSSTHANISQRQVNMEQAMFVAEGGMECGARFMESNLTAIVNSTSGATNGSGTINSGTYTFFICRTNDSTTYCIISTGVVNNVKRVVSLMDVYQPTYAEYALWSVTNGAINFMAGEVFNGKVHSDDKLYFDNSNGGPVFHALVTSNAGTYSGSISGIEFDQGFLLNTPEGTMADVDFNSAASTSLKNTANTSGLLLSGSSTITFNGATISVSNFRQSSPTNNHVYSISSDPIIYVAKAASGSSDVAATVYLKGGKVTGRLTIVNEADMTIANNITYTTDPRTTPSSTDALGLITADDIWVGTTAPDNLEIDAALMATGSAAGSGTDGSFGVTGYNTGSSRGFLTVYGGIVQETRGAVGTGSGGTVSTGYGKSYSYDPRFIVKPPPYYPVIKSLVNFSQWTEGH